MNIFDNNRKIIACDGDVIYSQEPYGINCTINITGRTALTLERMAAAMNATGFLSAENSAVSVLASFVVGETLSNLCDDKAAVLDFISEAIDLEEGEKNRLRAVFSAAFGTDD